MSIDSGRMLGPYQVLSLLGAGGMGEVYRARDTRLERSVAIKVLPSDVLHDEGVRIRFEREARAISSLSHPNICALHDVGRDGDDSYLVMEMLEGETLADRIARGPLPLSQVARYGAQIADALAHAHRAGITHRDLKPGNIMITAAGAKLLDFGLAKFVESSPSAISRAAHSETAVQPLTAEGTIVGTFQYLSPEQLEGTEADHRADIFALGVVLYEMATGQRPFKGESRAILMRAILTSDPVPLRSLQPAVPAALERIILTALEKRREHRWQTAHDVGRQLQWLSETSSSSEAATPPRRVVPAPILAAGAAVLASVLTWAVVRNGTPEATQPSRLRSQIAIPSDKRPLQAPDSPSFAISPNGKTLCFLGGHPRTIHLRSLDSFEITQIPGTEGAFGPFWSSDGNWIGFSARGKLWKIRVAKGAVPEALCEVSVSGAIGSWVGNTILFVDAPDGRKEIHRVADTGGAPVKVIGTSPREWRQTWPLLLPDGKRFLFLSFSKDSIDRELILSELGSSRRVVLLRNVSNVRASGERLLYVRDGTLFSHRFDPGNGVMIGDPLPLTDHVSYTYINGRAAFDVGGTGTVIYLTDTSSGRLSITNRQGRETKLLEVDGGLFHLSLSPDGRRAAVAIVNTGTRLSDIWIYDLARGLKDRFTSEPGTEVFPVWSPDGQSIVYAHTPGGSAPFIVRRNLSESVSETLTPPGLFVMPNSFTPDGQTLFIANRNPVTRGDILRLSMKTRKIEPFLNSRFAEVEPQVSPDGQWLAFVSDATGVNEIYMKRLDDDRSPRLRISNNGGRMARWRADSRELFYVSNNGRMISVVPGPEGQWNDPRFTELFTRPSVNTFAALPDGQSLLLLEGDNTDLDGMFHVIAGVN